MNMFSTKIRSILHNIQFVIRIFARVRLLVVLSVATLLSMLVQPQPTLNSSFALPSARAQSNPIVIENQYAGTTSWKLDQPADDIAMQIKGYATATSVNIGGTIDFQISVTPAGTTYTIEIYRIGWYGGTGGRLMQSSSPLTGKTQPSPSIDPSTGMVSAANWKNDGAEYTLVVPTNWASGVYLAKLINANGYDNYITFVVRDDNRSADFLYQHASTTSQAYNNFPDDGVMGKSLYRYNSSGPNTIAGDRRAVKVSFDRPYAANGGTGLLFDWEMDLILWLEKSGYDVTYAANKDLHNNGAALQNHKGFISGGHDEYWTKEMFDAAENARDAGTHLAFMGANVAYWQSRLESNDRVLVVYKNPSIDPEPNPALKTDQFRNLGRAEQTLVGVQYDSHNNSSTNNTAYIVQNSNYWVYNDTSFANGSSVARITGYEIDRFFDPNDPNEPDPYPGPPTNGTHILLSNSPFLNSQGNTVNAQSSIYQANSGAWVFATGTMSWSWALNQSGYIDARIQQTTANILDTFVTGSPPVSSGTCILQQQGEVGMLHGNFVVGIDSAASGGSYVYVPDNGNSYGAGPHPTDYVDYCFTVTQAGIYRINATVYAPDSTPPSGASDSFWVQVNGSPAAGYKWALYAQDNAYFAAFVNNSGVVDPVEVTLSPGTHTVRVSMREDGARLDTIGLTFISAVSNQISQITQLAPNSTSESSQPTFTWNSDLNATSYDLVIYNADSDTVEFNQNYSAAQSACSGGGTCSIQLSSSLSPGNKRWLIRGVNSSGAGPWSVFP